MDAKERTKEIMKIFKKLADLNLGLGGFEEFHEFRSICLYEMVNIPKERSTFLEQSV